MARTSKTKITGEDVGEQAERTNRAAAVGAQGVQQAHSELLGQHRFGQQHALQIADVAGTAYERMKGREQERDIETGRQSLQQQELDLGAAREGFNRQGQGAPTPPLLDERQKKLEAEMARGEQQGGGQDPAAMQRRAEQAKKPMEMSGAGNTFVPSEQGQAVQKRKNFEADTDRIKAESYAAQTSAQLVKAQRSGDVDTVKNIKTNLMQPIKTDAKLLGDVATGKMNDKSWDSIQAMAAEVPDPELQKEIQAKTPGPRLRSFLSSKVAFGALNFVKQTGGDMPDGDVVDYTSPQMQQFTQSVAQAGQFIAMQGAEFGKFLGLKTLNDKLRFQNVMAARSVMEGWTMGQVPGAPQQGAAQQPGGGGAGPMGTMTPSSGQAPQAPPPSQQQMQQHEQDMVGVRKRYGQEPGGRSVGEMLGRNK